ncbi:Cytochrome b5 [Gryllus bimaculatus]|nr:Cytochrome b5 [Gryllus bimaculatus]
MMTSLGSEEGMSSANSPQPGLLSIAGDALALAPAPARAPRPKPRPPPAVPVPAPAQDDADLPVVSLSEVAWHDHHDDCWIVVYDRVYDLTPFLWEHPGGEEILLDYAGRDATLAFAGIGHGPAMLLALRPHLVGRLPEAERIYSVAAAERGVLQLLGVS